MKKKIEILAPAKDLIGGMAAINSGADAVYIGAPQFGARSNANNSIEDVAELGPAGPNFISLQTRQPNLEGKGEIDLQVLLREALRMRPDRIALGEVRGSELLLLLQALNTGHSGAGATIHANSLHDVPSRLASIAQFSGFDIAALARQLVS